MTSGFALSTARAPELSNEGLVQADRDLNFGCHFPSDFAIPLVRLSYPLGQILTRLKKGTWRPGERPLRHLSCQEKTNNFRNNFRKLNQGCKLDAVLTPLSSRSDFKFLNLDDRGTWQSLHFR